MPSTDDEAFGKGFFVMMFALLCAMIMILLGNPITGVIIILIGVFGMVMILLLPDVFPEKQSKRRRISLEPDFRQDRPLRRYGTVAVISIMFLAILYGMVWFEVINQNEAIIIAVFTIVFSSILAALK